MNQDKINFLKDDFIFLLKHLAPDARGSWGVMNGQQMVEHFVDVVKNASGKLKLPMVNEGEKLEKARAFMMSDKPFPENVKNPFISETPPATRKEFNIRRYKLSRWPTASLNAGYSKIAQRNKFDFYKGDYFTASSISVRISVPIFNGFATDARIKKAELELQQTVNNMENLRLSIDNEVEQSRTNFRSAIATMDFQRKNMELAVQVYEQTKKKYEMGLGSNIEITAAQTDLKAAQTNYISSLYDAIIARIDFLKSTGKLL